MEEYAFLNKIHQKYYTEIGSADKSYKRLKPANYDILERYTDIDSMVLYDKNMNRIVLATGS